MKGEGERESGAKIERAFVIVIIIRRPSDMYSRHEDHLGTRHAAAVASARFPLIFSKLWLIGCLLNLRYTTPTL